MDLSLLLKKKLTFVDLKKIHRNKNYWNFLDIYFYNVLVVTCQISFW